MGETWACLTDAGKQRGEDKREGWASVRSPARWKRWHPDINLGPEEGHPFQWTRRREKKKDSDGDEIISLQRGIWKQLCLMICISSLKYQVRTPAEQMGGSDGYSVWGMAGRFFLLKGGNTDALRQSKCSASVCELRVALIGLEFLRLSKEDPDRRSWISLQWSILVTTKFSLGVKLGLDSWKV